LDIDFLLAALPLRVPPRKLDILRAHNCTSGCWSFRQTVTFSPIRQKEKRKKLVSPAPLRNKEPCKYIEERESSR
jgi:hypothetical protein